MTDRGIKVAEREGKDRPTLYVKVGPLPMEKVVLHHFSPGVVVP